MSDTEENIPENNKEEFKELTAGDAVERSFEERRNLMEKMKQKMRSGWRNDPKVLQEYFEAVVANWKTYKGERKQHQVLRLQGFYRQALYGDCNLKPPANLKTIEGKKFTEWNRLKGMDSSQAKRRFITYMSEISPVLIDVMPSEEPPPGFPVDEQGQQICAKCNTFVGCSRPLLDQFQIDLRQQLFEDERLLDANNMRVWVANATANQRCCWGVHKAVHPVDIKPFEKWFAKSENGGYQPYDSHGVVNLVRDFVHFSYELTWDMQQRRSEYGSAAFNEQRLKLEKICNIYTALSGETYRFEVPCTRRNAMCNQRRIADGGRNHTHEAKILPPTQADEATHDAAIKLRKECGELGLKLGTGIVKSVAERCAIYRERIADHYNRLKVQEEARLRNEKYIEVHQKHKSQVKELGKAMSMRQMSEACQSNDLEAVMKLIKRNASPDIEGNRGMTPLICAVCNSASPEYIEDLTKRRTNINFVNKNGLSALMIAVRRKDPKMIHLLMKHGASGSLQGGKKGRNRNAMHWCAVHGAEEQAKILFDYVKEGGGDSLRIVRLLDSQDSDGLTPLMIAAVSRNGVMCKVLTGLGANPNLRNKQARTAAYMARHAGWSELADWLDKKVGTGLRNIETHSDVTFDRQCRFNTMKLKNLTHEFTQIFLDLLCPDRVNNAPIGPPSVLDEMKKAMGDHAVKMIQSFVDEHSRLIHTYHKLEDWNEEEDAKKNQLKEKLKEMEQLLRTGLANPNVESKMKPQPWTPLHCAAAMNDVRACKVFMKDGADPNYPNMFGTTPTMIAAQLNNLESLVELLMGGGDAEMVDTEGYTPIAYASCLPPALREGRDAVFFLLDGDTDGAKRISSEELLKSCLQYGPGTLRIVLNQNIEETSDTNVTADYKLLRLLERNGMTRIDTSLQVETALNNSVWRVKAGEYELREYEETASEKADREEFEKGLAEAARRFEEKNSRNNDDEDDDSRCPICTLELPCKHFQHKKTLDKYLKQKELEAIEEEKEMTLRGISPSKRADALNRMNMEKNQRVLKEAHLDDRNTDRSKRMANLYRERDMKLNKQKAIKKELAKLKADAMLEGEVWVEWVEEADKAGNLVIKSNETGERWTQHFAPSGKPYYINEESGITKWNDPREPEETEVEKRQREKAEAEAERLREEEEFRKRTAQFPYQHSDGTWVLRSAMKGTRKKVLEEAAEYASNTTRALKKVEESLKKLKKKALEFITPEDEENMRNEEQERTLMREEEKYMMRYLAAVEAKRIAELSSDSEDEDEQTKQSASTDWSKLTPAERVRRMERSGIDADAIIGKNPVPPQGRGVMMFTEDYFGQGGNYEGTFGRNKRDIDPYQKEFAKELKEDNTALFITATPLALDNPVKRKKGEKRQKPELPSVQISGWVFVALARLADCAPPCEYIRMSDEVWGDCLEGVREKFIHEWLPNMLLEPVIDVRSWKSKTTRCTACGVGYDRMKLSFTDRDWGDQVGRLCLPCMVRKELFERSKLSFPRTFRRNLPPWPFRGPPRGIRPESPGRIGSPTGPKPGTPFYKRDPSQSLSPIHNSMMSMSGALIPVVDSGPGAMNHIEGTGLVESQALIAADHHEAIIAAADTEKFKKGYKYGGPKKAQTFKDLEEEEDSIAALQKEFAGDNSWEDAYKTKPKKFDWNQSLASTATDSMASVNSDGPQGPRETLLLPYLVAKGHFADVERIVRAAVDKPLLNEGEGLLHLNKVLGLQAEMYKMMGLFPLALGLYLDCAEMTAGLFGFDDEQFHRSVTNICCCFRKMKLPLLSKKYLEATTFQMTQISKDPTKGENASRVIEYDKKHSSRALHEDLWRKLKAEAPQHKRKRRLWHLHGIGGFWSMYHISEGHCIAARNKFIAYCKRLDEEGEAKEKEAKDAFVVKLKEEKGEENASLDTLRDAKKDYGFLTDWSLWAQFISTVMRLRLCDNEDISRHLTTHLIQKHVAKAMSKKRPGVPPSPVAQHFFKLSDTHRQDIPQRINDYLKNGMPFEVELFDPLLHKALHVLLPIWKAFLYSYDGRILRSMGMDIDAEIHHIQVTLIQAHMRRVLAINRVYRIKLTRKLGAGRFKK